MPIEVKRLCHTYLAGTAGEKAALRDIELNIEKGEFFGIIGHTGSGKSTLLQHMGGIMPPEAGTVIVDGYDFARQKTAHRRPQKSRPRVPVPGISAL